MAKEKIRVLFVNQEIAPFLKENPVSLIGRHLPQGIQEKVEKYVHSCQGMV